jgi:hypothetical protein
MEMPWHIGHTQRLSNGFDLELELIVQSITITCHPNA